MNHCLCSIVPEDDGNLNEKVVSVDYESGIPGQDCATVPKSLGIEQWKNRNRGQKRAAYPAWRAYVFFG
jgi:hypothetical protein